MLIKSSEIILLLYRLIIQIYRVLVHRMMLIEHLDVLIDEYHRLDFLENINKKWMKHRFLINLPRYLLIENANCSQLRPSVAIFNAISRDVIKWKANRSVGSRSFFIWIFLSLNSISNHRFNQSEILFILI